MADPNVENPAHYNRGKIEVLEAIEDWRLNYHRGCVVKYVARAGIKDPAKEVEDLEKARWYLEREIELVRAEEQDRDPCRPNEMRKRKALPEQLNFNTPPGFHGSVTDEKQKAYREDAERISKRYLNTSEFNGS